MPVIKLSDETYRLVRKAAIYPFRSTATDAEPGFVNIPVDEEVFDRLCARATASGLSLDAEVRKLLEDCSPGTKGSLQ